MKPFDGFRQAAVPQPPLPDVPIDYAVLRPYGNVYVTQAATDAYGLKPFVDVLRGDAIVPPEPIRWSRLPVDPRIDIMVAGPGEALNEADPSPDHAEGPSAEAEAYVGGLRGIVRLNGTRAQITDQLVDLEVKRIQRSTGHSEITEDDLVAAVDGLPYRESLDMTYMYRYMAKALADATRIPLAEAEVIWRHGNESYKFLGNAIHAGETVVVAIGAAVASNVMYPEATPAETAVATGVETLALVGVSLAVQYRRLKRYMMGATAREEKMRKMAAQRANRVANDVYGIFSPIDLED